MTTQNENPSPFWHLWGWPLAMAALTLTGIFASSYNTSP